MVLEKRRQLLQQDPIVHGQERLVLGRPGQENRLEQGRGRFLDGPGRRGLGVCLAGGSIRAWILAWSVSLETIASTTRSIKAWSMLALAPPAMALSWQDRLAGPGGLLFRCWKLVNVEELLRLGVPEDFVSDNLVRLDWVGGHRRSSAGIGRYSRPCRHPSWADPRRPRFGRTRSPVLRRCPISAMMPSWRAAAPGPAPAPVAQARWLRHQTIPCHTRGSRHFLRGKSTLSMSTKNLVKIADTGCGRAYGLPSRTTHLTTIFILPSNDYQSKLTHHSGSVKSPNPSIAGLVSAGGFDKADGAS